MRWSVLVNLFEVCEVRRRGGRRELPDAEEERAKAGVFARLCRGLLLHDGVRWLTPPGAVAHDSLDHRGEFSLEPETLWSYINEIYQFRFIVL